jgi:hypothetical protein
MFDDSESGEGLSTEMEAIDDHCDSDSHSGAESDEDALAKALYVPPPSADVHELRKVTAFLI